MKIKDKKFIITGGNRGIGLAVAEMAAKEGAHVIIACRSLDDKLENSLNKLGAASVRTIQCDLSTKNEVEKLAKELQNLNPQILFNNAGLLTGGLLEEQNLDEIYAMIQVNLNALIHLSRAVIPGMLLQKEGKIINNSSVSGYMHFPCASTYAASKAAVIAFTNCLEQELVGTGISTLCLITPGIKTRMFDEIELKYAKNLEIPKDHISPTEYANKIKVAIESDQNYLLPNGSTGVGLWVARNINPLFRVAIRKQFKR